MTRDRDNREEVGDEGSGVSADADRATAVEPVPVSPLRDGIASASERGVSSDQYERSFYGIINRDGGIWTPLIFATVSDAEEYRDSTARAWGPKFARIPQTHKIVPVRFVIEPDETATPTPSVSDD